MSESESYVSVCLVEGVEGPSVYLDAYRVCGPKPWGGGLILHEWRAERADILRALDIEEPAPC